MSVEKEATKSYKIILAGHGYTGKTSLVRQYTDGRFNETYVATLGSDFCVKRIIRNKTRMDLNLWTLSGQQCDVSTVPSVNFRFADAVIIVFAINDDKSMSVLDQWKQKAEEIVPDDTVFVLVANKCDMKRIQTRTLEQISGSIYHRSFQTSAKTGEGVKDLFESVADMVLAKEANRNATPGFKLRRLSRPPRKNSLCTSC